MMTHTVGNKLSKGWRFFGSVVAIAVCGYFSLGTSCGRDYVAESVTDTVHFAPGQATASLLVVADGGDVDLSFDAELIVTRNGEPTAPSSESEEEPEWPPRSGTVCKHETAPATGKYLTMCMSKERDPGLYELHRQDVSQALDVDVKATVHTYSDCDGKEPQQFGIVLETEQRP